MKWDDQFKAFVLATAIKGLNHQYYEHAKSEVSDNTYDLLYRELERLEKKIGYAAHGSPTQSPGH